MKSGECHPGERQADPSVRERFAAHPLRCTMLCAGCGEDKAAACFSGSQKKRAAAAR